MRRYFTQDTDISLIAEQFTDNLLGISGADGDGNSGILLAERTQDMAQVMC